MRNILSCFNYAFSLSEQSDTMNGPSLTNILVTTTDAAYIPALHTYHPEIIIINRGWIIRKSSTHIVHYHIVT